MNQLLLPICIPCLKGRRWSRIFSNNLKLCRALNITRSLEEQVILPERTRIYATCNCASTTPIEVTRVKTQRSNMNPDTFCSQTLQHVQSPIIRKTSIGSWSAQLLLVPHLKEPLYFSVHGSYATLSTLRYSYSCTWNIWNDNEIWVIYRELHLFLCDQNYHSSCRYYFGTSYCHISTSFGTLSLLHIIRKLYILAAADNNAIHTWLCWLKGAWHCSCR